MSFQVIGYIVKELRSIVDNALLRAPYVSVILYIFKVFLAADVRHPLTRLVVWFEAYQFVN